MALLLSYCALGLLLLAEWPIISILIEASESISDRDPTQAEYVRLIEQAVGGKWSVAGIHFVTAVAAAPIMVEAFLLLFTFGLSVYWIAAVAAATVLLKVSQFVTLRVASYDKGPVLAVSALAIAIGAVAKIMV